MQLSYKSTMRACFAAYIVQAIPINFVPLLFLTFHKDFNIPFSDITVLITLNFLVQLFVDFLSAGFIDKIGYRASVVIGHMLSALGLVSIAMLPYILPDPFIGLLISVIIYASGGGLLEVLLSPIIEACPTDDKEKAMSLLHSFYCWGQMIVVLLSTVFFSVIGINNWRILAFIWAVLPVANMILFTKVPIYSLHEKGTEGLTVRELFSIRIFWVFMFMMLCAGACEHSVSQWASTFAEQELGVDKTIGDLAGPMSFAFLMGCARACYGKFGDRMDLDRFMKSSCILCIASYLCISIVPIPFVGLIGCALTGLSVGILWPATFSKSVAAIPGGNTAMFVFLALAGDLGCSAGPSLVGFVASHFSDNLKAGILAAVVFPVLMLICILYLKQGRKPVRSSVDSPLT